MLVRIPDILAPAMMPVQLVNMTAKTVENDIILFVLKSEV